MSDDASEWKILEKNMQQDAALRKQGTKVNSCH
jgi:hypothetical protein